MYLNKAAFYKTSPSIYLMASVPFASSDPSLSLAHISFMFPHCLWVFVSVWTLHMYAIKMWFSPVNLYHVNLILNPAGRTLKGRGRSPHWHYSGLGSWNPASFRPGRIEHQLLLVHQHNLTQESNAVCFCWAEGYGEKSVSHLAILKSQWVEMKLFHWCLIGIEWVLQIGLLLLGHIFVGPWP